MYDHFKIICIYTKNSVFNLFKHAIFDFLVTQTNRARVSEGEKIVKLNKWKERTALSLRIGIFFWLGH